jgi:hypothetical protein
MTCLPRAGKKMGQSLMIVWKMIEILQNFLGKPGQLEMNLWMRSKIVGFPFPGIVGFHRIEEMHLKSPSKFLPLFLPCRALSNSFYSLSPHI